MTLRVRDGLVVSERGEAHFVTDLETGEVHELNPTARRVLEAAREGLDAAAIAHDLSRQYPEVPPDEVAGDVREVLDHMVRLGLLTR